ncbi:MAG: ABC transporter permease [Candidatus Thermoplasmatota archaeon]|nr:ABC transporter permease [Candidatus Thermoplasmatota archaeon]MCL5681168.1 ABC transporter permease [Candidatus Thermoplasmatota archaeon]
MNPTYRKWLTIVFSNRLSASGFVIISIFLIIALLYLIFGNLILPYNPIQINLSQVNAPPSFRHLFGTDQEGRDIFSRVIAALPVDLGISMLVVVTSAALGLILGVLAGYYRGIFEEIIMRVTDLFFALPPLIMAMAIAITLGSSLINASIAIIIVWWPPYVRLVRGSTLEVTANEYITMSKVLNTPFIKIFTKGIFPNIVTSLLVYATMDIGTAILTLSTLGFLGIGIPVGTPELGVMSSILSTNFYTYPLEGLIPAFFIFLIVMGFSLTGEGVAEIIDPNIRGHLISRKRRLEEMKKIKAGSRPSDIGPQ